jgi:plastocyanin
MKIQTFFLIALFLVSCSKKQEEQEAAYSSAYKAVPVSNGSTIKGMVKTIADQKYLASIATQKDQDVCGSSHPNPAAPAADGGVANCIVGIESISEGKAFTKSEYTLDQKTCDFKPHVQIVNLGSPIIISNSDNVLHNYHVYRNGETIVNEAQPEGAPAREAILKQKGLHNVNCDVHPWMRGFIWMADHPYYTMTDANGAFTLGDVPPGNYKLILWRDNWNVEEVKNKDGVIESYKWGPDFSKSQEITVEAGKEVVVDFTLP